MIEYPPFKVMVAAVSTVNTPDGFSSTSYNGKWLAAGS
jgi:hypothetical protein